MHLFCLQEAAGCRFGWRASVAKLTGTNTEGMTSDMSDMRAFCHSAMKFSGKHWQSTAAAALVI